MEHLTHLLGTDGYACLIALVMAMLTAGLLVPTVRSIALGLGAVDRPGGRRIHTRPTARLGGLAVLAAILVGSSLSVGLVNVDAEVAVARLDTLLPILGIGALVCLLGAWDDVRSISPRTKLLGLAIAGALLVASGVRIEIVEIPGLGRYDIAWLAFPVTVLWVLACSNAINLIDGVDGASSGVGMVSSAVLAAVALGTGDGVTAIVFCAMCGATAGFLIHNRHPATIFLGDSGSLLLGFMLAANSAAGCTKRATALSLTAALLALAVPFLDSTQSFVRRFRKALSASGRRRVWSALKATAVADHHHIHHRLLFSGLSHRQVTRALCLVTLTMGLTALLLLPSERHGLLALVGAVLAGSVMLLRLAAVQDVRRDTSKATEPEVILPAAPPREAATREVGAPASGTPQRDTVAAAEARQPARR